MAFTHNNGNQNFALVEVQLKVICCCAGAGSRLQQIVEWLGGDAFEGALVFDECHKAKNCIAKQAAGGRTQGESKTSRVNTPGIQPQTS